MIAAGVLVVAIYGLVKIPEWTGPHVTVLPAYVARDSRDYLGSPSCEMDGLGDVFATVLVGAPPNIGTLKIVTYLHLRAPGVVGGMWDESWFAFFNTDDPNYENQGSNELVVAMPFEQPENQSKYPPAYCTVKVVGEER